MAGSACALDPALFCTGHIIAARCGAAMSWVHRDSAWSPATEPWPIGHETPYGSRANPPKVVAGLPTKHQPVITPLSLMLVTWGPKGLAEQTVDSLAGSNEVIIPSGERTNPWTWLPLAPAVCCKSASLSGSEVVGTVKVPPAENRRSMKGSHGEFLPGREYPCRTDVILNPLKVVRRRISRD